LETIRSLYAEAASQSLRAQAADEEGERGKRASTAAALLLHAKSSESGARLEAMTRLAKPFLTIQPERLDANQWLLNCTNGLLDLQTGALKPHNPREYISRCLPIAYEDTASCPQWERFLLHVLGGDTDLMWFLQKAIGYSLTGDTREQCLFFLYGLGQNGKSTFLHILSSLLGSYAEQTDFSTFAHKEGEGIRNDLARIRGARTVMAVEAGEGKRLDEVLVKRLTGGDTITARFLYAEYFSYTPTFKIWFAANHKPTIHGTEKAIWRRIRLIPFQVAVSEEEKDPELGKKLLDELPGILRWAVFGCRAWQVEGLLPPCSVIEATEGYKTEQDALLDYLEERCLISEQLSVSARVLYDDYVAWCGKTKPIGINGFSLRMKERGIISERSTLTRKMTWKGIGFRVE
jgi:putative DNA primase/helicase